MDKLTRLRIAYMEVHYLTRIHPIKYGDEIERAIEKVIAYLSHEIKKEENNGRD